MVNFDSTLKANREQALLSSKILGDSRSAMPNRGGVANDLPQASKGPLFGGIFNNRPISDQSTRLGLTAEATSASAATGGLVNGVALNAEQPKSTIQTTAAVVEKNNENIDEAIDPNTTMLAQATVMPKSEPLNKPKSSGPEKPLGDVEIA